jgi:peptidyl-prolyl cis-trans isomerase C
MENEKVLASVNGKQITQADVETFIAGMGQQGQAYRNPQGYEAVLEQLINQNLLLLDAQRNLYEREPAFKAQLSRVKDELLVNYAIEKTIATVNVTADDAKKYFEENPDMFAGQATVAASHILVESEDEANDLLAKIQAGEITFADAAAAHSKCPSSRNGGSLGEFSRGQMVPEFDEACFTMEVGELRGPVKTQFGYHLIQLDAINEAKPLAFSDVREELIRRLTAEKQQSAYRSKLNQLKILYPVDKF